MSPRDDMAPLVLAQTVMREILTRMTLIGVTRIVLPITLIGFAVFSLSPLFNQSAVELDAQNKAVQQLAALLDGRTSFTPADRTASVSISPLISARVLVSFVSPPRS